MLAQNFKTAAELGLAEVDFDALRQVLGMLERGELVYANAFDPVPNGFTMTSILTKHDCGTACCIAGWATIVRGGKPMKDMQPYTKEKAAYDQLIMPAGWMTGKHTPAQAAIALRSYLTTGEARWEEALT